MAKSNPVRAADDEKPGRSHGAGNGRAKLWIVGVGAVLLAISKKIMCCSGRTLLSSRMPPSTEHQQNTLPATRTTSTEHASRDPLNALRYPLDRSAKREALSG